MRIGIDTRLINETGVGRYIRNLLRELATLDRENEYIIYLPINGAIELPSGRWKIRRSSIRWHSISEQIILPFYYLHDRLDLLHVPYFTIPILYPGKMVTTVHDLTILFHRTGKATTLPYPLYLLKWLGYRFIVSLGLSRVSKIITVSKTTKDELIRLFPMLEEKIMVTYEGVDPTFLQFSELERSHVTKEEYFLYVGNAYPHKNLNVLLDAVEQKRMSIFQKGKCRMVLVGKHDYFFSELKKEVRRRNMEDQFLFEGNVSDERLRGLYYGALALVFPSRMEGFGLPAQEALACECPVIASDIPVFHELLPASFVTFVNPNDSSAWGKTMERVYEKRKGIKSPLWKEKYDKNDYFEKFSWKSLAKQTLEVYKKA